MESFFKKKVSRDKGYLKMIAALPCCLCYLWYHKQPVKVPSYPAGGIAHHYGSTGKGIGQKCSDYETVPICFEHHLETHTKGVIKTQKKYGVNYSEIAESYQKYYGVEK
jgi:hypothetical protein